MKGRLAACTCSDSLRALHVGTVRLSPCPHLSPEDASTLIAGLVGALASKSGGGGDGEAAAGAATAPGSEELEGLVLELVGDDRLLESLREASWVPGLSFSSWLCWVLHWAFCYA